MFNKLADMSNKHYLCTIKLQTNIKRYKEMNENQSTKPFLTQLRELEVGGTLVQPASRASYAQSACCRFGLEWDKVFSVKTNRENRTVTITRTK